jgi:hypothetical protein
VVDQVQFGAADGVRSGRRGQGEPRGGVGGGCGGHDECAGQTGEKCFSHRVTVLTRTGPAIGMITDFVPDRVGRAEPAKRAGGPEATGAVDQKP